MVYQPAMGASSIFLESTGPAASSARSTDVYKRQGKDDVALGEGLVQVAKVARAAAYQVARDVAALREHKGHVALGVDHDGDVTFMFPQRCV